MKENLNRKHSPQDKIPPRPQSMKYLLEPNSQESTWVDGVAAAAITRVYTNER